MLNNGAFITFEGGEGSGKSTQMALLHGALKAAGIACLKTREPGGSAGAEKIRSLLVSGEVDSWDAQAETLLFYAARVDHVNRLIRPALSEGKVVICDRFSDSTIVYQGIGKKLGVAFVQELHMLALGNFMPGLTILLDIDPREGLKRAGQRKGDETRFEAMSMAFHEEVRAGFLSLAEKEPGRIQRIDAGASPQAVHEAIIALASRHLGVTLAPCPN